jgi:hypothetical protein
MSMPVSIGNKDTFFRFSTVVVLRGIRIFEKKENATNH